MMPPFLSSIGEKMRRFTFLTVSSGVIPGGEFLSEFRLAVCCHDLARGGPCHDVHLARVEFLHKFHAVATDIYTQSHTQRVGKALTYQILGSQLPSVIVVISLRPTQRGHNQFAVSLDIRQVKLVTYHHRIEHRSVGCDKPFLLLRTGYQQAHKPVNCKIIQ